MYKYPEERKQAILRKMAPPQNMTVAELAIEEGISGATLYNWRKQAREEGAILPSNSATPEKWSSEDKFHAVLQTASMTQAELSEYCGNTGFILSKYKLGKQPAWLATTKQTGKPDTVGKQPVPTNGASRNSNPNYAVKTRHWQKQPPC